MNTGVWIKALLAAVFSLVFAAVAYFRCGPAAEREGSYAPEGESGYGTGEKKQRRYGATEKVQPRYQPLIDGRLLPVFFLVLMILAPVMLKGEMTVRLLVKLFIDLFLPLSLYYGLLLCLLPFLRERINARTCALLWMMPNYLYIIELTPMQNVAPRLVVPVPALLVKYLLILWLTGAAAYLLWKIIAHMVFRRRVLRSAVSIRDGAVWAVWRQELDGAGVQQEKWKGQLLRWSGASTPFTIGLFRRSLCVVLPERSYTREELELIFRHELIHMGRQDSWSKFFMAFCTAMCWYHPLMWMAMGRCAEDLELSCDETVLLGADDGLRQQYANLLLRTAGEERGFTTCLSASAAALRHRLCCVVKPPKRYTGGILVGLISFFLCMGCGTVALAYGEETGETVIFGGSQPTQYSIRQVDMEEDGANHQYTDVDETALYTYFAGLKLQTMTGTYDNVPAAGR